MFSLEREKLIAWYEKCIPGFVKHKINVFMKNSVGTLSKLLPCAVKDHDSDHSDPLDRILLQGLDILLSIRY